MINLKRCIYLKCKKYFLNFIIGLELNVFKMVIFVI